MPQKINAPSPPHFLILQERGFSYPRMKGTGMSPILFSFVFSCVFCGYQTQALGVRASSILIVIVIVISHHLNLYASNSLCLKITRHSRLPQSLFVYFVPFVVKNNTPPNPSSCAFLCFWWLTSLPFCIPTSTSLLVAVRGHCHKKAQKSQKIFTLRVFRGEEFSYGLARSGIGFSGLRPSLITKNRFPHLVNLVILSKTNRHSLVDREVGLTYLFSQGRLPYMTIGQSLEGRQTEECHPPDR